MDLPSSKGMHGYIGRRDFSGEIIKAHVEAGWHYHCRITIWKDPVVEMQRTKAVGLLYKQLKKDSCKSRMGNPDYLLVFYKPGDNPKPVGHKPDDFPVDLWQQWASPVWMDIQQGKVLNGRAARENRDEKHICPLQLDVIQRCLVLWSNKGDRVFSPFMGIGSEGYESVKSGRYFIGTELKPSYFKMAYGNLEMAESEKEVLFK
jgi:DNA modification methylase